MWNDGAILALEEIEEFDRVTLYLHPGYGQMTVPGEWIGLAVEHNSGNTAPAHVLVRPNGWKRAVIVPLSNVRSIVTTRTYQAVGESADTGKPLDCGGEGHTVVGERETCLSCR